MPRWLVALIIILVIVIFILPNPTGTGTFLGNAVDSIVVFFRAIGNSGNSVCPPRRGSTVIRPVRDQGSTVRRSAAGGASRGVAER